MGIRKYKPTSAGRRNATVSDFADLTPRPKPEKTLLRPLRKTGGRNNQGKITARHRGGGHKRRYRVIDFRRNKDGVPATVASIQYDPNRSARIALLHYVDGEKRYILAPDGLKVGHDGGKRSGGAADGRQLPAAEEHSAGDGGSQHRAAARAGCADVPQCRYRRPRLMAREADWAQLVLPSGEIRRVPSSLPGDDRQGRQLGSHGRFAWARRAAIAGWAVVHTFAVPR